jgi:hypothetical protein
VSGAVDCPRPVRYRFGTDCYVLSVQGAQARGRWGRSGRSGTHRPRNPLGWGRKVVGSNPTAPTPRRPASEAGYAAVRLTLSALAVAALRVGAGYSTGRILGRRGWRPLSRRPLPRPRRREPSPDPAATRAAICVRSRAAATRSASGGPVGSTARRDLGYAEKLDIDTQLLVKWQQLPVLTWA